MDNNGNIATGCRERSRVRRLFWSVLIIGCLLVLSLLPGCSPRIIEKVVYQRDTTVVHRRDSIVRRDSIYVKEWMKGDTVYIDRFRDKYIYKDRWRDSIRIVRDSVAVETIKEIKVDKPLSAGQKAKIGAFWWLLCGLAACLGWIFRKPILSFIKRLF